MAICILGGSKNEQDHIIRHIKNDYIKKNKSPVLRIEIYDLQKTSTWESQANSILSGEYGLVVILTKDYKLIPQEFMNKFNELYCRLPQFVYEEGLAESIYADFYELYSPALNDYEFKSLLKLKETQFLHCDVNEHNERIYEIFCAS